MGNCVTSDVATPGQYATVIYFCSLTVFQLFLLKRRGLGLVSICFDCIVLMLRQFFRVAKDVFLSHVTCVVKLYFIFWDNIIHKTNCM